MNANLVKNVIHLFLFHQPRYFQYHFSMSLKWQPLFLVNRIICSHLDSRFRAQKKGLCKYMLHCVGRYHRSSTPSVINDRWFCSEFLRSKSLLCGNEKTRNRFEFKLALMEALREFYMVYSPRIIALRIMPCLHAFSLQSAEIYRVACMPHHLWAILRVVQ